MAIRPVMLYGSECQTLKCQQEQKMGVIKIRMLRWMSGRTRKYKLWNDHIWKKVRVAPIKEKMTEIRLQQFGHVQRRPLEVPVRKVN